MKLVPRRETYRGLVDHAAHLQTDHWSHEQVQTYVSDVGGPPIEREVTAKLPPALGLEIFQPINTDQRHVGGADDPKTWRKLASHHLLPSYPRLSLSPREAETATTLRHGKPDLVQTLRASYATRTANLVALFLSALAPIGVALGFIGLLVLALLTAECLLFVFAMEQAGVDMRHDKYLHAYARRRRRAAWADQHPGRAISKGMGEGVISNITALWLIASVILVCLIGAAIAGVMAWHSHQREAEEDDYFPPDCFPEIEIEGHRYHYDGWPFG